MTTYTHNAHGTKVRIEDQVIGNRIIQTRMQCFQGQWVSYWRSSHPIRSRVREVHTTR